MEKTFGRRAEFSYLPIPEVRGTIRAVRVLILTGADVSTEGLGSSTRSANAAVDAHKDAMRSSDLKSPPKKGAGLSRPPLQLVRAADLYRLHAGRGLFAGLIDCAVE
jgi:hypothetical protein